MVRAEFCYPGPVPPAEPNGAPPDPATVHDPRVLRAIAHPVRNRVLSELAATGAMRAADVARQLGIPANQASFHLRQLAKYGLVEEAPEEARDKRDRVWRATTTAALTVNLGELEKAPGGRTAGRSAVSVRQSGGSPRSRVTPA